MFHGYITMMKLVVLLLFATLHTTSAETSMKGWEIYSWFDMKCSARPHLDSAPNADSVCFALLVGTNRNKTTDEIRKAALPLKALEQRITTLAAGEQVVWTAPDESFDLPDAARGKGDPRNRAVAALAAQHVKLTIVRKP